MTTAEQNTQILKLRLTNSGTKPLDLVLKPWGDSHPLQANDEVEISMSGPSPANPELCYDGSEVTFYGWPGSTVELSRPQEETSSEAGTPTFPSPEELSELRDLVQKKLTSSENRLHFFYSVAPSLGLAPQDAVRLGLAPSESAYRAKLRRVLSKAKMVVSDISR